LNILLIAPQPFFQDRGTPIAVKLLSETLAAQGHNVHLLVYHEGEQIELPNIMIHRSFPLPGTSNIKPGLSLKKILCDIFIFIKCISLLRQYKIDLIHAVEEAVFIAILFNKTHKIPYVFDMDSCMPMQIIDKFPSFRILSSLMKYFERAAVQNSAGVLTVCKFLQETATKYASDKHIAVIEDITLLDNTINGDELLRESLMVKDKIIMYVGNLEKYQGIDLLLESFKLIQNKSCDVILIIIGGSTNDIQFYKNRAKKLCIDSKTFFCGSRPVKFLGYYLSQADILVSPRIQGNNTPMKIYSYMDSGKPVIATNLPTHTQVLNNEISYLVAPAPEAMAAGIIELLYNVQLRETLANNAKQKIMQEYSISAYTKKLTDFYNKLPVNGKIFQ